MGDQKQVQKSGFTRKSTSKSPLENESPLPFATLMQHAESDSHVQRTQAISQLQSTLGNQAVQRVLGAKKSSAKTLTSAGIMSYVDFRRATGQESRFAFGGMGISTSMEEIMSGKKGLDDLQALRTANNLDNTSFENRTSIAQLDINGRYNDYQQAKTLDSMLKLYNVIKMWQTVFVGMPFVAKVNPTLERVLAQIQQHVTQNTKNAGGDEANSQKLLNLNAGPNAAGKKMPEFLQNVGIPHGYYVEHILPNQDYQDALEDFYVELEAGHHFAAAKAYEQLTGLPQLPMIKSLFMAYFPKQSNLKGLVGTKSTDGALTDAERAAIITYTGGAFDPMNWQLRDQTQQKTGVTIGQKDAAKRQDDTEKRDRAATMKLAVSGLNKLPKYRGATYRTSPKISLDTLRKGATFADLGFMSASPSVTGVINYKGLNSPIYFVIHSKTAVNVAPISKSPMEAEVLFRPGTPFRILNVWQNTNGIVPSAAPAEVQILLYQIIKNNTASETTSKVIEMAEM